MKTQFVYDGSYAGLFTCMFEIYERKCHDADIVRGDTMEALSLTDTIDIVTDKEKAKRVWKGLTAKVSDNMMKEIYYCFLSEMKGIDNWIFQFVKYVFSSQENVEHNFGNPAVLHLVQTARKVGREKHRFEAFIRFENIGDTLFYAPIDPDYNVLPIVLPHFKRRYADQNWIICDTKRKYGIHYNSQTEELNEAIIDFSQPKNELTLTGISFDPDEKLYQDLWKNYFKSTNIVARRNMKLHLQHVPKRYWKYLVEKK